MYIFYFIVSITFFIYVYNSIISLFGLKPYRNPDTSNIDPTNTFDILIPCHNEESVIYWTLKYCNNIDYPKDKYNVYVILDNCSDKTESQVDLFTSYWKTTNINKIIVNGGSKPKALNKAISYLKSNGKWNSDNIIILDADNKISPTLLKSYNYYHSKYKILQCRILSDNDNNIISKGFASSFNYMGRTFQYARNVLKLSASLSGTGFSINRNVWDEIDFTNCDTLTEDLEFSILSILKGYKIKYVPEEYVLNQNLEELKPSITQRVRWCRGHMQVAVKLDSYILKQFFKKPSLQLFDSFLFVNNPPKSLIYLIANIGIFIINNNYKLFSNYILLFLIIYNLIIVLISDNFNIKYIIPHYFYSLCMRYAVIIGSITFKNNKWVKTKHKEIM